MSSKPKPWPIYSQIDLEGVLPPQALDTGPVNQLLRDPKVGYTIQVEEVVSRHIGWVPQHQLPQQRNHCESLLREVWETGIGGGSRSTC